ncbi:MAG: response regulator [Anaerolineae bacterium]|nr:response regulator [Anaerolineae bacterium]
MHVMIVDDDRSTTSLLKTLLELDGFEVSVVARGADALPMAEKKPPCAIVLDYHLSDMRGTQIIRAFRGHAGLAHTPIIVSSGMDVSDEVMAAGATAFLGKPYDPADLSSLLNRLIQS